jgi:hypothetical protein
MCPAPYLDGKEKTVMPYDLIYEIACSFPALRFKGVSGGDIPGIAREGFDDAELSDYLYKGQGAALSHGEQLILEFLLNLADPYTHTRFNLGIALNLFDPKNMDALIKALIRFYNRH